MSVIKHLKETTTLLFNSSCPLKIYVHAYFSLSLQEFVISSLFHDYLLKYVLSVKTHFCFQVDKFSGLLGFFVDDARLRIVTYFFCLGGL